MSSDPSPREAAFSNFVLARQTHLRRVAYGLCGDWYLAEDILQTALVKAYVAWPRIERGREDAYVRRILVRTNVDEHRRPWHRESAGLPEVEQAARTGLPIEERSAILDALQALPEMQRKVVVLRFWLGLSVRETAEDLGIGEGTAKSHSSRALHRLEELFGSRGRSPVRVAGSTATSAPSGETHGPTAMTESWRSPSQQDRSVSW